MRRLNALIGPVRSWEALNFFRSLTGKSGVRDHHNWKLSAVRRNRCINRKICRGCSSPKRRQQSIVLRGIQGNERNAEFG
jgi:hypothetical protein